MDNPLEQKTKFLDLENSFERSSDSISSSFAKKRVLEQLAKIQVGTLVIEEGDQQYIFGTSHSSFPHTARIIVKNPTFYERVFLKGDLGAADAYIQGEWECVDLSQLVQLFLRNRKSLESLEAGKRWLGTPARLAYKVLKRNTISGSKDNILAHYDLGNDFFKVFLDETMMYSSALFKNQDDSLHAASENKLEAICQQLQLTSTDHILEIGSGWGGFAIYAVQNYGCKVTTTTISDQQYLYCQEKIKSLDLEDNITLLNKDYRELTGEYDKLVSIEMIEAIGPEYLDTYFSQCSHLLKDDGLFCLQAITIADQRYNYARKNLDFIQKYIFPGGFLPSIQVMTDSIARKTDLRVFQLNDIGPHYAETLKAWRERFFNNIEQIRNMGFDETFIKMWEYYLCYCEGAFREQVIGTVQMLMVKPAAYQPAFTQQA